MRTELATLESVNSAIEATRSLFSARSKLFFVSLRDGDDVTAPLSPNAATSRIVTVISDIEELLQSHFDMPGWLELLREARSAAEKVGRTNTVEALPLRSFGVLPIFSTGLLLELLLQSPLPLSREATAIAARRLFREVFQLRAGRATTAEPLHPYLVYRIFKALRKLKRVVEEASLTTRKRFGRNMMNEDLLRNVQRKMYVARIAAAVYGTSDAKFRALLKEVSRGRTQSWDDCEQVLEATALGSANAALARFSNANHERGDPSALLFALRTLAASNPRRHDSLLVQGVEAVAPACAHGSFPGNMPFLVDDKGRITVVPSVETANAILAIMMARGQGASDAQVEWALSLTDSVEQALRDTHNTVRLGNPPSEPRTGWCSAKAPSLNRVDSWITVEALAFFARRLNLIRSANRREILKRYSWVPHRKCRPQWIEIDEAPSTDRRFAVKTRIESSVAQPCHLRETSPMFLLYGPPGTSKTSFLQALAHKMEWDLVTLSPSDFVEQSLDRIEQQSRKIFNDLMNLDRCVVLLDEMDSLMRDRASFAKDNPGTILNFVVPALLPKLQQLRDYVLRRDMAVFITTNYYEEMDTAIVRSGRLDHHLIVLPYDHSAQKQVLRRILNGLRAAQPGKLTEAIMRLLNALPCNYVYRDLERFARLAAKAGTPAAAVTEVRRAAIRAGIPPEYYKAETRRAAFREVYAFTARLISDAAPPYDVSEITEEEFTEYMRQAVSDLDRWPVWKQFAESWSFHPAKSTVSQS